jgi:hypothetical protein
MNYICLRRVSKERPVIRLASYGIFGTILNPARTPLNEQDRSQQVLPLSQLVVGKVTALERSPN